MVKLSLNNPFSDAPVYYREVTGSTMDDAKNDASSGISHGTIYRAGFQEKGRGRIRGREWNSESGLNLMFTIVLRRSEIQQELNFLPLIAGVSLTRAVGEVSRLDFKLKWPNDLLLGGFKCAGILCEADSEYFYCGIGVNCNQKDFPLVIKDRATSLSKLCLREIDLDELQSSIIRKFKYYLESGDLWRSDLEDLLYKRDQIIEIIPGQAGSDKKITGKNLGIGADGQLIVELFDGKLVEIYAGEIEM